MPSIARLRLEAWIAKVAASHGYTLGKINYIFCNDEGIIKVNRQFLNHDFYTDVITFDYTYDDVVSGDIYISAASTTKPPVSARSWKRMRTLPSLCLMLKFNRFIYNILLVK